MYYLSFIYPLAIISTLATALLLELSLKALAVGAVVVAVGGLAVLYVRSHTPVSTSSHLAGNQPR
jgi:hypothetical protein